MEAVWSEHWHDVRFMRPRLRDGVQILHRTLRGRPWVLLSDPLTQRFHRLSPQVWQVLQLLDGQRTLDQVWAAASAVPARQGTDGAASAPVSQHDLVQLLASLHANDLLQTQATPDAFEAVERYQKQRRQRFKQTWLNPLSLRLPLLYPDAWFQRHAGLARRLFSWTVAVLWLLVVAPASVLAWQHWSALTDNLSDRVLSGSNVLLLWLIYPAVKAVHECAHGLAVKAFGGTVREIGLIFMVFTPVPYVDATTSYAFPSKWVRALVAAAGIAAELLLGALALYVWLMAESGLVTAVAFNVVLIAGVSTLLVNGNPLMRYDGYFIACDLLEVPNLAQRATQYWAFLADRWLYGAPDARPPQAAQGERWLLVLYGAVSPVYRLVITLGLAWFVATEYLFIGAVMALWALWGAVVMPLWKGWKHLREGAALARRRDVALQRTGLALVVAALFLGVVPVPFHSVHQAVVWVPDEAIVRAGADGHLRGDRLAAGTAVQAGQTVLTLDNPSVLAERAVAAAALARAAAQLREAEVKEPARITPLRSERDARAGKLADAERRVAGLQARAGVAGRWVPQPGTELDGSHVRRGEVVGYIVAGPSAVVRSAVPQEDMALIRDRLRGTEVRQAQAMPQVLTARLARVVPGGDFQLVSSALGTSGGGELAVDPSQPEGTRTLRRVFDLELVLDGTSPTAVFGDRAHVRFDLGPAPLAWQWYLRLRQLFLARLNV